MYIERSSNQAEAIKCFQRVLELDRSNVEAITHLKEMYEKRRDWERLVDVMRAECDLLEPSDQPMRRLEIAQLATEKLRKPNVCIELWRDVLAVDRGQRARRSTRWRVCTSARASGRRWPRCWSVRASWPRTTPS